MDGVVVGSYPAGPPVTYGQPIYGYASPQPGCSTCQQHTWQPQYSQAQTWQNQRPQQTWQYAQPQHPHRGAPQHVHPQPVRQFPQPRPGAVYGPSPQLGVGPRAVQPGAVSPGAVGPGAVGPGAVQPGAAATPTPAGVSHTPGTALLGPGYAPRTVPVTRHLQTTFTTVR